MCVNKICIKCNEEKPLEAFCRLLKSLDGHKNICYACNYKRHKEYEEKNKEYRRQYWKKRNKKYYKENYSRIRAQAKKYRKINDKQIKKQKRTARQIVKQKVINMYGGKCLCCGTSYIEFLNIDHIQGKGLKERISIGKRGGTEFYQFLLKQQIDKTKYQILCQNCNWLKYRKENPRSLKKLAQAAFKLKLQVFENYGNKCVCCGETNIEVLTIDHIEGGGNIHRRKLGTSNQVYREICNENFPKDKYQLLCRNCNCAKSQYKCCPHAKEKS